MNNHHLIGKLRLDMRLPGNPDTALEQQQQINRHCEQALPAALAAAFDRLVSADEVISIERLEVEVRGLPAQQGLGEWVERVARAVTEAVEKQLYSTDSRARTERKPLAVGRFEAWLYFLEHGALPMSGSSLSPAELQTAVLESVAAQTFAVQALLQVLRRSARALERLVQQHSEPFQQRLAEALTGRSHAGAVLLWVELAALLRRASAAPKRVGHDQVIPTKKEKGALHRLAAMREEGFWRVLWQQFVLTERPFEPVLFIEKFLASQGEKEEVPGLVVALAAVAEVAADQFSTVLPALQAGVQRAPASPPSGAAEMRLDQDVSGHGLSQQLDASDLGLESQARQPAETAALNPPRMDAPDLALENQARQSAETPALNQPPRRDASHLGLENQGRQSADAATNRLPTEPSKSPVTDAGKQALQPAPDPLTKPQRSAAKPADEMPPTLPVRTEKTHWYVENAGAVLLHPFLPGYFQAVGLLGEDKQFRHERAQHQAVYLLHYLATGQAEAQEYDLVFAKHLCGLAPETPLLRGKPRGKKWLAHTRREAAAMLSAVIRHWARLGSATPDGLRGSFLTRPGKLTYAPHDGWLLQVEQSGLDILLGSLPWGLSIVRTPWMKEMLHVEWG